MATLGAPKTTKKAPEPRLPGSKKPRVFDYSKYRQTINDQNEFMRFAEGYPDKTGINAYFYRLLPKIDLSMIGVKTTNIFETANLEEMSPLNIGRKFGRGKYLVRLIDANKPENERERAKSWFKLEDLENPPVYDLRTLCLAANENIDEVARQIQLGNLVRDPSGNPRIRTSADGFPVSPHPSDESSGELLNKETVGQLMVKMFDRAFNQTAPMTAQAQLTQSIEIAKLLQPQFSVEKVADVVVARLQNTHTAGNGGAGLDSFETALKTYERVARVFGRAGGEMAAQGGESDAGIWGSLLEKFLDRSEKIIPLIFTGIERLQARRGPGRASNSRGGQPMTNMAQRIAEVMAIGFQKMQEGVTGFDFAAWLCSWHEGGLEVFRFLEPRGADGVMGFAAMNPDAAPLLKDPQIRQQLEIFLNDFFSYDPDGASDAGAGEEALPAAS